MEQNQVRLGKDVYSIIRVRLRTWLQLDNLRTRFLKAAENGEKDEFVLSMLSYLSAAFIVPMKELEELSWHELADALNKFIDINKPHLELPIFSVTDVENKIQQPWDYEERTWYLWANILAKSYGWTLEYIAELDVNDAAALIQEILVDEQLEHEWLWQTSPNAYGYDENTKHSRFIELPRPSWMMGKKLYYIPEKIKILKSMMPVGMIIRGDRATNPQ